MTDCIAMNQYGCTQWIDMPSNTPSTAPQTGGRVAGASRAMPYTTRAPQSAPRPRNLNNPAEYLDYLKEQAKDLPDNAGLMKQIDDLSNQLKNRGKPGAKGAPSQELQCLLSPPQSGSDAPLEPLQICWGLDHIKEAMEVAGLCKASPTRPSLKIAPSRIWARRCSRSSRGFRATATGDPTTAGIWPSAPGASS